MGDGAVDRLGVDVSVAGFDKFESHMNRVNELLDQFAAKAAQFSVSASTFNNAMQVFGHATTAAKDALIAFRQAARDLSATGKTIGSLTNRITKLGAAFASFGTTAPGVAGAIGHMAQNLSGLKLPGAGRGAAAAGRMDESTKMWERQSNLLEEINRRRLQRQRDDEVKAADQSARLAQKQGEVLKRNESDLEKIRDRGRDKVGEVSDTLKTERAAQQARIDAVREGLERTARLQAEARKEELGRNLLGLRNQGKAEAQVEAELQGELNTIRRRAQGLASQFSEQGLRNFKRTADEVRATSKNLQKEFQAQSQTRGPALPTLGRKRLREDLGEASLKEFLAGKAEQRARSANVLVRTLQQSADRVNDSFARLGFGFQLIGLRAQQAGRLIVLPFQIILAPIRLVLSLINTLVGAFGLLGKAASVATAPFRAIGSVFGRKQQQPGVDQGKSLGGNKAALANAQQLNQSVDQSSRSIQILSGNSIKLGNIFSNLFRSNKQVSDSFNQSTTAINSLNTSIVKTSVTTRTLSLAFSPVVAISRTINSVTNSFRSFAASLTATLVPSLSLSRNMNQTTVAVNQAGEAVGRFGRVAESAFGSALGNLAARAIEGSIRGLNSLGRESIGALGDFERLEASFQTLSRREIINADPLITFEAAEEKAVARAAELLAFTQKLAIISPFEEEGIAAVFRTGLAYEFTSEEARKLTQITVDYAAGTNQGIDAAEGIVLALGQVRSTGRLSGQELKQLSDRGVPALGILGKAVGKTTEELREFTRLGGTIDAELAISAIAKSLNEDFAGAAERSSGTVQGLISSINDLRKLSLRSFITPIADQILKPFAGKAIDTLLKGDLQKQVEAFGERFAALVGNSLNAIGTAVGTITGIFEKIPEPVIQTAKTFFLLTGAVIALAGSFAVLTPVVGLLAPVIGFLIGPIGIAIAAVSALAVAWRNNWLGIQQVAQAAVARIVAFFNQLDTVIDPARLLAGIGHFGALLDEALDPRNLVQNFQSGLSLLPTFVADVATSILDTFGSLLENVTDFGAGLVEAFAEGIVGAVSVVIDALNVLGQVIASFLAPGSPPKLLPDIDTWGTAAANEFLKGFTVADFDLLSDLAKEIEGALSSVTDKLDAGDLVKVRSAVALAVKEFAETGVVSPQTLDQIAKASGKFAEEISIIAPAYFNAAAAAKELEAAQENLNNVSEKYEKLLAPIEARLRGIEDATSTLDEERRIKQLQNVLSNRFATEEQKRSASLELQKLQAIQEKRSLELARDGETKLAQTRVDSAEEQKKAADEQLELLQKRLGFETDILKAMNAQGGGGGGGGDAADKLKKLKELKGELGELTSDLPSLADLELKVPDIEETIAPAIEAFNKRIEDGKNKILSTLDALRQDIVGRFTSLRDAFVAGFSGITLTPTANSLSDQLRSTSTDALGQFANKLGLFARDLAGSIDLIQKEFARLQGVFNAGFGAGPDGAKGSEELTGLDALVFKAGAAAGSLNTAFAAIVTEVTGFGTDLSTAFEAAAGGGEEGDGGPIGRFFTTLEDTDFSERVQTLKQRLIDAINGMFGVGKGQEGVVIDLKAIRTGIETAINNLFSTESVGNFSGMFANVVGGINTALGKPLTIDTAVLKTNVETAINNLFGGAEGAAEGAGGLVATVQAKLDLLFGDVTFEDLTTSFQSLKDNVRIAIEGIKWDEVIELDVFQGLVDAVGSVWTNIQEAIQNIFSGDLLGAGADVAEGLAGFGGGLGKSLAGAGDLAGGALGKIDFTRLSAGILATITSVIAGAIGAVVNTLKGGLQALAGGDELDRLQEGGEGSSIAKDIASGLSESIVGAIAGIIGAAINLLTVENIKAAALAIIDIAFAAGNIIKDVIVGIFEGAFKGVSKIAEDVKLGDILTTMAEAVNTNVIANIQQIIDTITESFDGIKLAVTDFSTFAESIFVGMQEVVDPAGTKIAELGASLKTSLDSIGGTLRTTIQNIQDFLSNPLSFITGSGEASSGGAEGFDMGSFFNIFQSPFGAPREGSFADTIGNLFAPDDAQKVGVDLAAGIQTGYEKQMGVTAEFADPATAAIGTIAGAIGAQSPSSVADEKVGVPLGEGIIQGFTKTLDNADLSAPINAFVAKIRDGISAALTGGLSSSVSESVRDSASGGLTLGAIKASLDLSFGKIKFENLATAFENLKNAIADTIAALTWEVIVPETFDPLANTINETLISVKWDGYIKSDSTWDPFAVVVEETLRAIQWASYITTATWASLARRIAATLAAIPWATYITVATWTSLAKRVGDTLKAIPWNSYVTVDTWAQLASAVAETLKRIPWSQYVTASTFASLAQAVVDAINLAIRQQVGPSDFSGAANAIINALNSAVIAATGGLNPPPTEPVVDPIPTDPDDPRILAAAGGNGVIKKLMAIADVLRGLQSAGGGVLPIGQASVPFGASTLVTNSNVSVTNNFNLYQNGASQQTLARSGRSFEMFRTLVAA